MKRSSSTFLNREEIIKFLMKVDSAEKAQDLIILLESDIFTEELPAHLLQPLAYQDRVLVHWKSGKRYRYLGEGLDATTGEKQVYYVEPGGSMIYNRTPEEMYCFVENYQGEMVPRFILEEENKDETQSIRSSITTARD